MTVAGCGWNVLILHTCRPFHYLSLPMCHLSFRMGGLWLICKMKTYWSRVRRINNKFKNWYREECNNLALNIEVLSERNYTFLRPLPLLFWWCWAFLVQSVIFKNRLEDTLAVYKYEQLQNKNKPGTNIIHFLNLRSDVLYSVCRCSRTLNAVYFLILCLMFYILCTFISMYVIIKLFLCYALLVNYFPYSDITIIIFKIYII